MKTMGVLFIVSLCAMLCASCSTVPSATSSSVQWRDKAVELSIKGDPYLNLYQNNAHALYLCVCQLKDPNAFNQMIDERGGMERLLSECNRFDGSVAYAKRYVIQPGQTLNDKLDHAEGARFLGMVAGYYYMKRDSAVRLFPMSKTLNIQIELGPRGIQGIREK